MMFWDDFQGTPVFEIPVYALSFNEYKKRWENKCKRDKQRRHAKIDGDRDTSCQSWSYGQLVGMLLLTVKKDQYLYYNFYCNPKPPKTAFQSTFLPLRNQFLIDEKLDLSLVKDDEVLVNTIKEKCEFFKRQMGLPYYFDTRALENSLCLNKILVTIEKNKRA